MRIREERYSKCPLLRPTGLKIGKRTLLRADLDFSSVTDDVIRACYHHELDRQLMLDNWGWWRRRAKENNEHDVILPRPFPFEDRDTNSYVQAFAPKPKPFIIFSGERPPVVPIYRRLYFGIACGQSYRKKDLLDWWNFYGQREVGQWLKNEANSYIAVIGAQQGKRTESPLYYWGKLFNLICYRLAKAGLDADQAKKMITDWYKAEPLSHWVSDINQDSRTYGRRISAAHQAITANWKEMDRYPKSKPVVAPRRRRAKSV